MKVIFYLIDSFKTNSNKLHRIILFKNFKDVKGKMYFVFDRFRLKKENEINKIKFTLSRQEEKKDVFKKKKRNSVIG